LQTIPRTLFLLTLAGCSGGGEPPPDVLLISLDSVRADVLTFLDEEAAPNMARLAKRGTVFTQALSGTSWTLPSHAQMFTGNPPLVNGVQIDTIRIDPLHATLPERLRERGYWNAGFFTGWYLSPEYGFERGFDIYASSMTIDPADNEQLRAALEDRGDTPTSIESLLKQTASHQDITSKRVVADLRDALEQAGDERPRFQFLHFFDPHFDYIPPAPHDTAFDPDYAGAYDGRGFWDNKRVYDQTKKPRRQIPARDLEHVFALYRGEIAWTDRAVGEVLEALEESGRLERTLIIITADHGEEFFEHGNRGHRNSLYDEVLRVPLLIVPPGAAAAAAPRTVDAQVTLSDLMPTVLDYAGTGKPAGVYGRSLRPLIEGGTLTERPAASSLLLKVVLPGEKPQLWLYQAVRTPGQKFIRTLAFHNGRPQLKSILYYDLVRDPGETHIPKSLPPGELERLWTNFENDLEPIRAAFDALPHSSSEERATTARAAFADELGPLGYADGEEEDDDDEQAKAPKPWLWSPPKRLQPPR
jgi:arylsulfatase A-like enzyme